MVAVQGVGAEGVRSHQACVALMSAMRPVRCRLRPPLISAARTMLQRCIGPWISMRRIAIAASAALLTALLLDAGFDSRAGAQPAEPDSGVTIDWEVKSRFRLFRRESDFQRHVIANR